MSSCRRSIINLALPQRINITYLPAAQTQFLWLVLHQSQEDPRLQVTTKQQQLIKS